MNEQTRKRVIVVIEDNAPDVFLLEEALTEAGVDCELVSLDDGEKARAYIRDATNERTPDLFLVDLNLPRLNGAELLALIRQQPSIAKVPVIVWSSLCDKKTLDKFGVEHFFTKPSSLEGFVQIGELIRTILSAKTL